MTLRLDPPRRVGDSVLVAASRVETAAHPAGGMLLGTGRKTPRLLLVQSGGRLGAIDLDGIRPLHEIDADLSEAVTRHIADWSGAD